MRMLPVLAIAGVLFVFAGIQGQRLVSLLYAQFAQEFAAGSAAEAGHGRAAAWHSEQLAPWQAAGRRAQLRLPQTSVEPLLRAAAENLRWSPADPYLWMEYAQVLALRGLHGDPTARALQRVHALAAHSPALQLAMMHMGLRHWPRGHSATRQEWLRAARYTLRVQGRKYLRNLKRKGEPAARLCATMGPDLELDAWCESLGRKKSRR